MSRLIVGIMLVLAFAASSASAAVQPYGTNDAGGFRKFLPPGENGVGNAIQELAFQSSHTYPPHWTDQQPLYENLLYAAPTLTDAQIPNFYKDATFGVQPGDVASTISPRPGVTIVRDSSYGVPHIYGDTRADVMFGAGFAGAADRLFLMDVLRHTGRAELSSFVGGSAADRNQDRAQWQFAPYTEQDLQRQIDQAPLLYGQAGVQAVNDVNEYVAGINAYINAAKLDPSLMPAEYTLSGTPLEPWKATDVVATASLIGAMFGKGGGREVDSALVLQSLEKQLGRKMGRSAWAGFREKNDPHAPTTVSKAFPYENTSSFARKGLAIPDPGSYKPAPVAPPVPSGRVARSNGIGAAISRDIQQGGHASNWELVSAKNSVTGHPLAVMGPQVGYYTPQILMEEDLHGPGIDARGAAFPGVNLFVELGHGTDYAWSATSAGADNVDTFAEPLCKDNFHYVYKGKCTAMERLDRTNSWTPGLFDKTPAGSETLTAYRTVHGIVIGRGKVHGRKVAYVSARTTYFHEPDSVIGFSDFNNPADMRDPAGFQRSASQIGFTFNWAFVNSRHIAYYMSGALPQRVKGTSTDFPVTAKYFWKGFNPQNRTEKLVGFKKHPQAVDPGYLVSWNNKQAPKFSAADDRFAYGPVFRSQMIADKVKSGTKGARRMTLAELIQSMELPATQDLRAYAALPAILKAIGRPGGRLGHALKELKAWRKAGSFRRDLNRDGVDENNSAIEIMDAWWPRLLSAEFKPTLGGKGFDAVLSMQELGGPINPTGTQAPHAPGFETGWWGYVTRDLGMVVKRRHRGEVYCGNGSLKRCRAALRSSLKQALGVTPKQLYGFGRCTANPQPSCWDQNSPINSTGFPIGPFPFQNRPTFQQAVSILRSVP